MDRYTARDDGIAYYNCDEECPVSDTVCEYITDCHFKDEALERLALLEDMIEQGELVDNDLIQDMLGKTASLHPYKVPGRMRETCSQYNKGWQDTLDVFSSALSRLAELEGKKE